ncbi:unnamed protein product [Mytilus coruscus]|uniref:Fibrinogen C-terminal domain-containing protein n=1 Tax=Mytilus coruscus TaxID=42192 RepID=A0A6J8DR70_MYTCO|nr:unnamed protein product [Mytilus coruscus]
MLLQGMVESYSQNTGNKVTSSSNSGVCFYGDTANRVLNLMAADGKRMTDFKPKDCKDLHRKHEQSGIFKIYPDENEPQSVYCDMETDGGGWTVKVIDQPKRVQTTAVPDTTPIIGTLKQRTFDSINRTKGKQDHKRQPKSKVYDSEQHIHTIQKTRILDLENEVKQLRNVLQTLKERDRSEENVHSRDGDYNPPTRPQSIEQLPQQETCFRKDLLIATTGKTF